MNGCLTTNNPLLRLRIFVLLGIIAAGTVTAWLGAVVAFRDSSILMGMALVAYTLGLRHAVDADHVAAIDNITRKLIQDGGAPVGVGFFFAAGHAAVVATIVGGLATTSAALGSHFEVLRAYGAPVATITSAAVLFAVAAANLIGLRASLREHDAEVLPGGLLTRFLRPMLRIISKSWHALPVGILFGLGFETATEVSLLGFSAAQAADKLPFWSVMLFPALFAVGMMVIDTTDGVLMLRLYRRTMARPRQRRIYNLAVTGGSAWVAAFIGTVELLGLAADQFGLTGGAWDAIEWLNDNFNVLGLITIGSFAIAWIVAAGFVRHSARPV